MRELAIQTFLRSGGSLESLLERYAVKHRRHGLHRNLILFKYDQIASPFAEPIVRECRGIVLDEMNHWAVVSRAFDKFFNYGEQLAASIDWSTARVQEKVDGSLCTLYFYASEWHVATTGTPDASGDLHLAGRTFASLFWEVFDLDRLFRADTALAYYFELTSPFNRIVVRYGEPGLTLLGARNVVTGEEVTVKEAHERLGASDAIAIVREHSLNSVEAIVASFDAISPLAQEGYVVVDAAFSRIKLKHPGYVALHHAALGHPGAEGVRV